MYVCMYVCIYASALRYIIPADSWQCCSANFRIVLSESQNTPSH